MADLVRQCGGTLAQWAANDVIVPNRLLCLETDTGKMKVGNGSLLYSQLPYTAEKGDTGATGEKGDKGDMTTVIGLISSSITSVLIPTVVPVAKTFVIQTGKDYVAGMTVMIASDAAPSTNYMSGKVTSYSGSTLIVDIDTVNGSGTHADWSISYASSSLQLGTTASTAAKGDHGHGNYSPGLLDKLLSPDYTVNPFQYGAAGSAQETTGTINSGSKALIVTSTIDFEIGHGIAIFGAGSAGGLLISTISDISGTTITITDNASTSAAGARTIHDDSDAIQSADDAMFGNRGVMLFSNGVYYINKPVVIANCVLASLTPGRGVNPYGAGGGIYANQSGAVLVTTQAITMVTLEGGASAGVYGLSFVTETTLLTGQIGLHIHGSALNETNGGKDQVSDGFVQNCWFGWCDIGIKVDRAQGWVISNNIIDSACGIEANRLKSSIIANNVFLGISNRSVVVLAGRSSRNTIVANKFQNIGEYGGLDIKEASHNAITGNHFSGSLYSIKFFSGYSHANNNISGNTFIASKNNSILFDGTTEPNSVTNNTFGNDIDGLTNYMPTASDPFIATAGTCSNLTLADNTFDFVMAPAYSASSTYALYAECSYGGHNYSCSTPITVPEAFNAAKWFDKGVPKTLGVSLSSGTTATVVTGRVSGLITTLCQDAAVINFIALYSGSAVSFEGGNNHKLVYYTGYGGALTGSNVAGPASRLRVAQGTADAPTATALNNVLGSYQFGGRNETGWNAVASATVVAQATENYSGANKGARISLLSTANGAAVGYPRLTIEHDGSVRLADISDAYTPSRTVKLAVDGEILAEDGIRFPDNTIQTTAATGGADLALSVKNAAFAASSGNHYICSGNSSYAATLADWSTDSARVVFTVDIRSSALVTISGNVSTDCPIINPGESLELVWSSSTAGYALWQVVKINTYSRLNADGQNIQLIDSTGTANGVWDATNKKLGLGTTAPDTALHIKHASGNAEGITLENNSTTTTDRDQIVFKRSTNGASLTSGTILGLLGVQGFASSAFESTARPWCWVETAAAWTDSSAGYNILFKTRPTASGTSTGPTTRLTLLHNGQINIAALSDYADDAAAATGGIAVGSLYRTASVVKWRVA